MSEFEDLYGEWGRDANGNPLPLTLRPYLGSGQDGDVFGAPVELPGLPREDSRRLVRSAQGDEVLSTLTVYAPAPTGALFVLGSRVTVDNRTGAVLQVKHEQGGDLGDFYTIAVE